MSNLNPQDNSAGLGAPILVSGPASSTSVGATTYTFPDASRSPKGTSPGQTRGHSRSVSHGGSSNLPVASSSSGIIGRSALKGNLFNYGVCCILLEIFYLF